MNAPKSRPAFHSGVLLVAVLMLATGLGSLSCGGDDSSTKATDTPKPAATGGSPAAQSGPGGITVTSGPISGQNRKMLLINAVPEAGGAAVSEACIPITSDKFTMPATAMINAPAGQSGPCSGTPVKAKLPEGSYTITAGIYAPPAQAPEKQTRQTVQVKGDITVQVDGAALSK